VKYLRTAAFLLGLIFSAPAAQFMLAQAPPFAPFESGERLVYQLLWPSGLPLGEAVLEVSSQGADLHFQLSVEARLPQYRFSGTFSSVAKREGLCSLQFHQKIEEGRRTSEESMEFDQTTHHVQHIRSRGTTTDPIPECARDPLTFLYYVRTLAAAGKAADPGSMHYAKGVAIQLAPGGPGSVDVGGAPRKGEKLAVHFPTRRGQRTLEVWLASDAVRTPLHFTVPTSLAEFKAELE
jgi:hypothetical protein